MKFTVTGIDVAGNRVVDAPSSTPLAVAESLTITQEDIMEEPKTEEEKPKPRTVRDINGGVHEIVSTRAERRQFAKLGRTWKRQASHKKQKQARRAA